MRKFAQRYTLTIVSLALTLFIEAIGNFIINLDGPQQFIVLALGLMTSLVIATIEREVRDGLDSLLTERLQGVARGLELYNLLRSIDDSELEKEAVKLVRKLSMGEIPADLAKLRSRSLIKSVRKSVLCSDYRRDKEAMTSWWLSGNGTTWFASNVEALSRKIRIERHFLLNKAEVIKPDGTWDHEVANVLRHQARAGIVVRVLWIDDVYRTTKLPTREILQDFNIFDGTEVSASGIYTPTLMYRHPSDKVHYYLEVFEEQRQLSFELKDVLRDPKDPVK